MSLDQKIQVLVAAGTWLSSIGTIAAVIVALYLARRTAKVRLKVQVGLRVMIVGDGSPPEDHLSIEVTNLGERPVTINSVGWAIGKGKKRRFGFQTVSGRHSTQYPAELAHGKTARFMVSFRATPQWMREFARGFVKDLSDRSLRTLVALINTSVGQTIEAKPEKELLEKLKGCAEVTGLQSSIPPSRRHNHTMEPDQQRPYHIQAIYDLQAENTTEHFRFAIGECRKVISRLVADDNSSDQQIARVNVLRYLDLQLSRAMEWADAEADLLAIVLRSEIELRGWAEFVSESSEQATRFLNEQVVVDAHELDKYMRKAFPTAAFDALPTVAKADRVNPPRIGETVEYDFKLCSKLMHPSALMLNHPEMTIRSDDHKAHLRIEVLLYAWMIVDRFHDINWV